jgi:hypothetical protein
MARDLLPSSNTMFAGSNSANTIYGVGTNTTPRPRGLFYIRFRRPTGTGGKTWQNSDGYFAKSVDLPTVTPQVEELNQYNKKRIIHTGVKYNPVTVSFYDTADGGAASLWSEYAKYYFGDFNHANQMGWTDDITSNVFSDPEKTGYGFGTRPGTTLITDSLNTQFFFEAMEIYQVFAGTYTQTDIINPKINSYEHDGLDYEDMAPLMIRMGLTYESIVYHNDGGLANISDNEMLTTVFSTVFSGNVYNPDSSKTQVTPFAYSRTTSSSFVNSTIKDLFTGSSLGTALLTNIKQSASAQTGSNGVLSRYGSFSFGNVVSQTLSNASSATLGNSAVARSSNLTSTLFDGDNDISIGQLTAVDTTLKLSDEALGIANTFSNGTVQLGKKGPPDINA